MASESLMASYLWLIPKIEPSLHQTATSFLIKTACLNFFKFVLFHKFLLISFTNPLRFQKMLSKNGLRIGEKDAWLNTWTHTCSVYIYAKQFSFLVPLCHKKDGFHFVENFYLKVRIKFLSRRKSRGIKVSWKAFKYQIAHIFLSLNSNLYEVSQCGFFFYVEWKILGQSNFQGE